MKCTGNAGSATHKEPRRVNLSYSTGTKHPPVHVLLTTAAFLAGISCRTVLELSGFTAATTAGCTSAALRFWANLGDETTLTTDGFTFTLGLATRNRKYLINSYISTFYMKNNSIKYQNFYCT